MLSRFWLLRGWEGGGGLSESVKKGKFVMKIFFSDNVARNKRSTDYLKIFYKKYLQNLKHNVNNFG